MLSNFIGGGQIFLHNLRMFIQVLKRSITASILIGLVISFTFVYPDFSKVDLSSSMTYQKALLASYFDKEMRKIRAIIKPSRANTQNTKRITTINAYTKDGLYKASLAPDVVLGNNKFATHYKQTLRLAKKLLIMGLIFVSITFVIIFARGYGLARLQKRKNTLAAI